VPESQPERKLGNELCLHGAFSDRVILKRLNLATFQDIVFQPLVWTYMAKFVAGTGHDFYFVVAKCKAGITITRSSLVSGLRTTISLNP